MFDPNREVTIIRVLEAERPPDIPLDHIILNAPRGLFGHREWAGPFRHGLLYVAIDPLGYRAVDQLQQSLEYDGWVVEYVTPAQIDEWITTICANPKYSVTRDRYTPERWEELFFQRNRSYSSTAREVWQKARNHAAALKIAEVS